MSNVLVISSYPKKTAVHGKSTVGIASYAKNTLIALRKNAPKKMSMTVLAEKLPDDDGYSHSGIQVERVWSRNSFLTFPKLLFQIIKNHNEKVIVMEFELSMFGSLFHLLPLPVFLLFLKCMRKKVLFVNHQVIPNIKEIGPHINISEQSFRTPLYNLGLRAFYTLLLLLVDKVIVFEEVLKQRLAQFGSSRKISVIPHGVEEFSKVPTKSAARKKLGLNRDSFIVLSFGYLAWYKGTDWVVDAMKQATKMRKNKITLILAGGPNPNHLDKQHYQKYIQSIEKKCRENGFIITGFISEKEIPMYYSACDIVVLPYRNLMSSSGPLSLAFSFKKPFLLSEPMKGLFKTNDISESLDEFRIKRETIYFGLNDQFLTYFKNVQTNKRLAIKLSHLSNALRKKRSWNAIGNLYYQELNAL